MGEVLIMFLREYRKELGNEGQEPRGPGAQEERKKLCPAKRCVFYGKAG